MSESKDIITRLNPVARAILQGLYDTESPLHKLLGLHYVLKAIWNNVIDHWRSRIKVSIGYDTLGPFPKPLSSPLNDEWFVSFVKVKTGSGYHHGELAVQFPKPTDININMMPFVMESDFKKTKLPRNLRFYWESVIKHCIVDSEVGNIGYLTIDERYVDEGLSHRRPGVHTESPGVTMLKKGRGIATPKYLSWGEGLFLSKSLKLEGGIYMASNVENSCRVWNCQIQRPEVDSLDIVGKHGDVEHLREWLSENSEVMEANRVYWITDRTPHESLPLAKGTYRQFFRLVTSLVGVWFQDHSTKNPNGVVPDPKITKIVRGSKFDETCCVVDP